MRIESRPLDLCEVLYRSTTAREMVDLCRRQGNDEDKAARILAQECQGCFYLRKAGGAMMTSRQCGLCDTEVHSCNTCIDRLCTDCARKNRLCKHCGGDIDMKQRRKL